VKDFSETIEEVDGIRIIRIFGAFTMATTPYFQKICHETIHKAVKGVLLDFAKVTAIDTAAFACMVGFIKEHLKNNPSHIAIVNINEKETAMMQILKIGSLIHVFSKEDEAMRFLQSQ